MVSSLIGEFSTTLHNYSNLQGLVTTLITLGFLFVAIRQISLGRKWARTVLLILIVFGLLAALIFAPMIFRTSLALGFLFVLQSILEILALVFLYRKESNTWFNSLKNEVQITD